MYQVLHREWKILEILKTKNGHGKVMEHGKFAKIILPIFPLNFATSVPF